ncbi:uncharacterized protein LOC134195456 [Corticium candelabrum]|uniref:uncharacterized protein LOC134195456 n=1 Tax=Corticium candelabrum TaxID=121492 RepID=UPI002E26FE27|nr:uncharacterized protein LOC134195456 [Corticium candelabrum]
MVTRCCVFTAIAVFLLAVASAERPCSGFSPSALPFIMAQQSAKLVAQIRDHQQRDKTLTEIKSNITAIGQHGSVLLNLVRTKPNEEDQIVSELVASINLLSKIFGERDEALKNLQNNLTSITKRLCQRDKYGRDGSSKDAAGQTCKSIRNYIQQSASSTIRWINPSHTPGGEFQIFCDMNSFGGGWNLIYSSRDDSSGHNNMKKGDRSTAHITSLDPGNANKRLAYDVFKAIEASSIGYEEVMLTGYRDYRHKNSLIKMYFNKTATSGVSFSQFIEGGITGTRRGCGTSKSYYGTEISSGKPIALSWEDSAFVAGAVSSGCSWSKEVWNEIDAQGGHLLAPKDWSHAESYNRQSSSSGSSRNYGLFHIFIR